MFNLELPEGFDGRFFRHPGKQRCDVAPLDVIQSLDVENLSSNLLFLVVFSGYRDGSCRCLLVGHELLSSEALEMVEAEGLQENA